MEATHNKVEPLSRGEGAGENEPFKYRQSCVDDAGWLLLGSCLAGATRLRSLNGFEGVCKLQRGGMTELNMRAAVEVTVPVAAAGLLGRSAASLTWLDLRRVMIV